MTLRSGSFNESFKKTKVTGLNHSNESLTESVRADTELLLKSLTKLQVN